MTCKDCIFNEICERQEDLVQLDDFTWDEYGESNEVERYCSIFRNKADFVEVVRCRDCKRFMEYAEGKQRIEGADGDCSIRMMNTSDVQFWGVTFNDYCSYGKRKEGAKQ